MPEPVALDPVFLRAQLAEVQRRLRVLLAQVQRLQDSLPPSPIGYRLEIIAVRRKKEV